MGLDLTKQGNLYQKTNAGRTIGIVGGGTVGYKVLGAQIKNFAVESMKELPKDVFQSGNISAVAKDAKFLNKLAKNSGTIGAIVAALVIGALGGLFDDTVNSIRANKADKKANQLNQQ